MWINYQNVSRYKLDEIYYIVLHCTSDKFCKEYHAWIAMYHYYSNKPSISNHYILVQALPFIVTTNITIKARNKTA